jgi:hypothetical protein
VVQNNDVWWIDPIVAFLAGGFTMFLGVWALREAYHMDKIPIISFSWWLSSKDQQTHTRENNPTQNDSEDSDLENIELPASNVEEVDMV